MICCCTAGVLHTNVLDGLEGGRWENACVSVNEPLPPPILYKGSSSGVQELLAEWHSCLAEPVAISRNLWSALLQLKRGEELCHSTETTENYWYVHFLFKESIALLCFQLMGLSLLFWGQWTSVEARTGYLSGYISSSALNVCVCRSIAFKVQTTQSDRGGLSHIVY